MTNLKIDKTEALSTKENYETRGHGTIVKDYPSYASVKKRGRDSTGSPKTLITDKQVGAIHRIVLGDRRLTVQ